MFVSPRFRDFFAVGPIRTRRRERPVPLERTNPAAQELDEVLSNAEAILLAFAEAHLRALRAKATYTSGTMYQAEFIPAPVFKAEFIPAKVSKPEFIPAEHTSADT